jgi:hypothetical protein
MIESWWLRKKRERDQKGLSPALLWDSASKKTITKCIYLILDQNCEPK